MEEFDRRGVTPRIDSPNHVPAPISVTMPTQLIGRADEVLLALHRCARIRRIGKVAFVGDASPLFLQRDLALKVRRYSIEIRDHHFDLRDPAPLLVHLEPHQPHNGIARLHIDLAPLMGRWRSPKIAEKERQPHVTISAERHQQ
jgi:hypothetical protein